MNKETTLELLNRFVDRSRDNMNRPFSQELSIGKYLCATDAKIVVLIPETAQIKIENEEGYKPPNINGILPKFDQDIEVNFKDVLKLYDKITVVERYVMDECESCDGEGEFTHYGNKYKCKKYDEIGEVQTMFREKVKNPNTVFRHDPIDINIKYIASLIEIFNTIKPERVSIVKLGKSIIWFKMDQIFVGISGMMLDERKKWDIVSMVPLEQL